MNTWNKLLAALDSVLGFPNKKNSKVKKLRQAFDNNTGEYVFWLEYRISVYPPELWKQVKENQQSDSLLKVAADALHAARLKGR